MNLNCEIASTDEIISVEIPKHLLVDAWLEKLGVQTQPRPDRRRTLPAIGSELDDGIFAGITIDNGWPAKLVLLPGDDSGSWDKMTAWATSTAGVLPSRIDGLVLLQNLRHEFRKEIYWTSEQVAGDESFAWFQSFYNGYQDGSRKGYGLRARAVRRLPLE